MSRRQHGANKDRITASDRFMPCVLDRLTDENPHLRQEKVSWKVFSIKQLKAALLRDLSNLLNSRSKIQEKELTEYKYISSSVLNYGIDSIVGMSAESFGAKTLEDMLLTAIKRFEPRLDPDSLQIVVTADDSDKSHGIFLIEISAKATIEPLSNELYIKAKLDLETGTFSEQNI